MKKTKIIINFVIIALLFLTFISSCGSESSKYKPEQQSLENEQKSEKIPDQLKTIENDIERIFQYLNAPSVSSEDNKNQSSSNSGNSGNKNNTLKGESTEGNQKDQTQKQGTQQQQGSQQQQEQQQQPDLWEQITASINDIHNQWNSYMPLAAKNNASASTIENFSNALNNLTNTAAEKNLNNTLLAANSLYSYIPDFYSLYRIETSPEIKKMRHFTRSIIINSKFANWTEADLNLSSLKSSWSLYKSILPQDMSDSSNTLDLSIHELDKVVKQKNELLTEVKGKIVLNNIIEMEKTLKKNKG